MNRFINDTSKCKLPHRLYYYPAGTGNDFLRDITQKDSILLPLNTYISNLPMVTVAGQTYRFLNGVGYGIDGYCCQEGDALRRKTTKPVNYTAIAIKGLLFHYKPTSAVITVDGKQYTFQNVWLAPTMNGRYYGGGMMPAPEQDRLNEDHTVSTMVFCGKSKLKTLCIFPSIFKGNHIKHTKQVTVLKGKDILVRFERPTPLQIDGETILGVTSYRVTAGKATVAGR